MKKKILTLILILMLLPIASIFSACGKNKNISIVALDDDFFAMARENNNLEVINNKLVFTYNNLSAEFKTAVESVEQYKELNKYNTLFNNLMVFSSEYIQICSNNSDLVDNETKKRVIESLNDFKEAVSDVDDNTNMFAEMIQISTGVNIESEACQIRFENLLDVYDNMFIKGANFHNDLSDLYYNHILNDENPNIHAISISDFDPTVVVSKLKSRISYQKANLTQSFVEMYVLRSGFAHEVATGGAKLDLSTYKYSENIEVLNVFFTEDGAVYKINQSGKNNFYDYSIQAYNLQEILNNGAEKFMYACNKINYNDVNSESSAEEQMCYSIIAENHSQIIAYNKVLVNMLAIIKGT